MPKPNKPTVPATQMDLVRLAAFIDGEGYIGIIRVKNQNRKSGRYILKVEVTNTDIRLGAWCKSRFGGSMSQAKPRKNKPNEKPCFHWVVSSSVAEKILRSCLPYFILKRDQAEIALAFREHVKMFKSDVVGPGGISEQIEMQRETLRLSLVEAKHSHKSLKNVVPIERIKAAIGG